MAQVAQKRNFMCMQVKRSYLRTKEELCQTKPGLIGKIQTQVEVYINFICSIKNFSKNSHIVWLLNKATVQHKSIKLR